MTNIGIAVVDSDVVLAVVELLPLLNCLLLFSLLVHRQTSPKNTLERTGWIVAHLVE